jgi:hypothetical protein
VGQKNTPAFPVYRQNLNYSRKGFFMPYFPGIHFLALECTYGGRAAASGQAARTRTEIST